MTSIILKLPYPPSINHYYKSIRSRFGVRMYIDEKGILYRESIIDLVVEHKSQNKFPIAVPYFPSEKLKLELYINPPDKRKRDLDNIFKAQVDSLQHALVFTNDFQIDKLYIERQEVVKNGVVLAIITVL